jgi:outer membrane protein
VGVALGASVVRLLLIAACAAWAPAALAQQTPPPDAATGGDDLVIELGLGGSVRPAYEGADDYTIQPDPLISLHYLRLPGVATFGGGPETGLSFAPSFRYVQERDDNDYPELLGLGDVDAAFELGGTVGYRYESLAAFLTLRKGLTGHHGWVGETGVNLVVEPLPRLSLSAGPRVSFANSDYLDTYLGVTPAQSAASGLPVFDPDAGIKGVGLAAEGRYALTGNWSVVGRAGYERLVGDAADSPVTDAGSENQFTAALGLTYRFGLDLFD